MAMNPIDLYLSKIENSLEREALENLRAFLHTLLPNAEECISYGMPAFRVNGECVAGFAKFKNHLSFFPFSGSVLDSFEEELQKYTYTKSGIHFTPEKPLSEELLRKIIKMRLEAIEC